MGLARMPHEVAAIPLDDPVDADPFAGLESPLSDVRRRAARALAKEPHETAVPALLGRLPREPEIAVSEAILTACAQIGGAEVTAGMVALLRAADPALRNGAVEVLQLLPDLPTAVLEGLLGDADPDVRILGVLVLGGLVRPDLPSLLARVVADDPDPRVCGAAIDVLAEIGDESAVAPLRQVPARFGGDPFITFAADLALRRILATAP